MLIFVSQYRLTKPVGMEFVSIPQKSLICPKDSVELQHCVPVCETRLFLYSLKGFLDQTGLFVRKFPPGRFIAHGEGDRPHEIFFCVYFVY